MRFLLLLLEEEGKAVDDVLRSLTLQLQTEPRRHAELLPQEPGTHAGSLPSDPEAPPTQSSNLSLVAPPPAPPPNYKTVYKTVQCLFRGTLGHKQHTQEREDGHTHAHTRTHQQRQLWPTAGCGTKFWSPPGPDGGRGRWRRRGRGRTQPASWSWWV